MGKITFITGGARSGKSMFAESLLSGKSGVLYVATANESDEEMRERIARHRSRRNPSWETIEAYRDFGRPLKNKLTDKGYILFDCITIMVSSLMVLDSGIDWDSARPNEVDAVEEKIASEVSSLITIAREFGGETFIVSNELGMGLVPANALGRHFRDLAGRVNRMIAAEAEDVYFMVSGIPVKIKG